jgi:enoyl-CoA hydratase/carnithine racemase
MIETRYEKIGDVVVVTMANPPANTFTMELGAGLESAVRRAASEGARALVLQADGLLFCGGADVHLFAGTTAEQAQEMFAEGFQLINTLENAPFPVIAAVHGMCFAAGLELALACDLIIAAEGAQFAQVEAKIGAATFLGGVYRLAERCGPARAKEIVFGAETYDAATFERWNIINRVVPDGELREAALAWAQQLSKGPTLAHAVTKRLLRRALDQGSRQADRYLLDVAPGLLESRDMQYAVELLLTQGARKFIQNHAEVVFEGR